MAGWEDKPNDGCSSMLARLLPEKESWTIKECNGNDVSERLERLDDMVGREEKPNEGSSEIPSSLLSENASRWMAWCEGIVESSKAALAIMDIDESTEMLAETRRCDDKVEAERWLNVRDLSTRLPLGSRRVMSSPIAANEVDCTTLEKVQ